MSGKLLNIATQIMVMAIIVSVVLLLIGIGVLLFIHVCIVGRAFRRGFNAAMRGGGGTDRSGLSRDDLEKLPCFEFKVGEKGNNSPTDCVVCLESFRLGDRCRALPICKHSFHAQCVDSWLMKTPVCPICRSSADVWKVSGEGLEGGLGPIELRGNQSEASASI
ncbi:RING-H2 finger protein ATL58 [Acorus calamus]|uniref:RING-H2 finger protein ATL58 n=1 Tax=Acorus calamus TaxID=4465 RepID=A0AAV9CV90_ACOCL|nr:RING-H2 finger protein ATL58 [Acorus calamus]